MQRELSQVREIVRNRIMNGNVPTAEWDDYVKLLDAIDSVLHHLTVNPSTLRVHQFQREERQHDSGSGPNAHARAWMVRVGSGRTRG